MRTFQIYKTVEDDDSLWTAVEDDGAYENSLAVVERTAYQKLEAELAKTKMILKKVMKEYEPNKKYWPSKLVDILCKQEKK